MLKYKTVITIFLLCLFTIAILFFYSDISPIWFILPFSFLFVFLALGSYFIQLSFYLDTICSFKSENKIAITFDDGPDEEITPKVLEVLKKHQQKASFFIIGSKAKKFPELIKQISDSGHAIGNHSYSHSALYDLMSASKISADIIKCNEILKQITGQEPAFFRPPYGVTNPAIAKAVRKLNIPVIGWNFRSMDTTATEQHKLLKKLRKVKPGDIILFHDRVKGIDKVLDEFLLLCKEKNIDTSVLNNDLIKKNE